MIVLWMTLFFLRQGYSLVPVKTVRIGEPVTLTCALLKGLQSGEVHWYKQNHGNTLNLIVTLFKSTPPVYGPEFSKSRFKVDNDNNFSNVTILKTVQEDEGIYHCGLTEWIRTNWSSTYLFVKGNGQTTSVDVEKLTGSNPLHPGETVTLQCSVSNSVIKTCPGLNVLWFRDRSHESPTIIYTNINTINECEKRSDTQDRCVYRFSKNVSSSDAGTYYCAVAICGEILFGTGIKLDIEQTKKMEFLQIALLICLAISVIGNVLLICNRRICTQRKAENAITEAQHDVLHQPTKADEELNYAALNFSERKTRGRKKRELAEESVYSRVK